jgi:hypothetical protein
MRLDSLLAATVVLLLSNSEEARQVPKVRRSIGRTDCGDSVGSATAQVGGFFVEHPERPCVN